MSYLHAAIYATWAIHIVYLFILISGIRKLRREADELERR
jgi:hypothetical protein